METDKTYSCRLFDDETNYLNKHFDGKFSEYVHNSFKRDINLTKNNKKQNKLQHFANNVVMLGLGAIFLVFSMNISSLIGFLMVFLMGVFFITYSLFNIFWELKKYGRFLKRQPK